MRITKLSHLFVLSTLFPFSAAYGLKEGLKDDQEKSSPTAPPSHFARNSAAPDIDRGLELYKQLASQTRGVHEQVVIEWLALAKLVQRKSKFPNTESAKQRLREFMNTQRLTYVPSRESEGLKAAVAEEEWAKLHFLNAASLMRPAKPYSLEEIAKLIQSKLSPSAASRDRAEDQFDQGIHSMSTVVDYAQKLLAFIEAFEPEVRQAIYTATGGYTYAPAEPSKHSKFVRDLAGIRGRLHLILKSYGIDVEKAFQNQIDIQGMLYQRCIQDPQDQVLERSEALQQLLEARKKEDQDRAERTAQKNYDDRALWLKQHSEAIE